MKIIDLSEEHKDLFCLCLEDWSDDAREAGPKRRQWLDRMQPLGLRAKLSRRSRNGRRHGEREGNQGEAGCRFAGHCPVPPSVRRPLAMPHARVSKSAVRFPVREELLPSAARRSWDPSWRNAVAEEARTRGFASLTLVRFAFIDV